MKQFFFFSMLLFLVACGPSLPEEIETAMQELPKEIDYNLHVKPILSDRCFACHGPDKNKIEGGLQLHEAATAFAKSKNDETKFAIVAGSLKRSEVFHRLISTDEETVMPPPESNLVLSDYEKAVLIKWIDDGAEYKPHWSLIKPERPSLPKVKNTEWANNEIDHFVLAQLEQKDWTPQSEAEKEILLRRVSLDLTGLPPSIEEMESFLNDDSPEAFEKAVDHLLTSVHYGERMATDWMDVARYADTHGYTVDRYRNMSPWRDWVIEAFNENMPFDQFVTWQLAGDLLPDEGDATKRKTQILATGFNRNHQQNMEGGIIPEEFRVEYVADRTNTLGAAFLGLTFECARCHDHKYDPISQKEYFEMFSFFNSIKEAGQISWDNATPVPTMLLTDERLDSTIAFLEQAVTKQEQNIATIKASAKSQMEEWLTTTRLKENPTNFFFRPELAHFNFSNNTFTNRRNSKQKGKMKQQFVAEIEPTFVAGRDGQALQLDGDAWLDLGEVGAYDRYDPFSVSIWTKLPKSLKDGVIFHKGEGAALFNFRGYHLALKDNRLEVLMARTIPYNAIIEYGEDLPREEWIQLTMTYDGSSKAAGLKVYLNEAELKTEVDQDKLYKSILFHKSPEPGLQIGARWRGIGVKGALVDDIRVFGSELSALEVMASHDLAKAKEIFKKDNNTLTSTEKDLLSEWFLKHRLPSNKSTVNQLRELRKQHMNTVDTIAEIMVMDEMEKPRPSYILERGAYDAHGEQVYPNTPNSVLPMLEGFPKNRLGLAQWLIHDDQPLMSRVIVNRYWQQFFGRGLVETAEDFGNQGSLPSHPELLDWLAVEFRSSGWDVKALLKKIVLSASYRQSSIPTDEKIVEADVDNVWLARGPSARLSAEMIRDNALNASGLLVKKVGGESVKPYQPEGLWRVNGGKYERDSAAALYRRSLYTFWKRTVPHPTQATFDAPSRSNCTVKRQKTNTPLQALVLLNDPSFTENAKIMGAAISSASSIKSGIANAFRKLTGRKIKDFELEVLVELQQSEYQKFQQFPNKAKGWLTAGESSLERDGAQLDYNLIAASAVVASTIINADATIVKR